MKTGKSWTENADEIDRLRAVNVELVAALVRCEMEMSFAKWGNKDAISARSGCLREVKHALGLARAALARGGK